MGLVYQLWTLYSEFTRIWEDRQTFWSPLTVECSKPRSKCKRSGAKPQTWLSVFHWRGWECLSTDHNELFGLLGACDNNQLQLSEADITDKEADSRRHLSFLISFSDDGFVTHLSIFVTCVNSREFNYVADVAWICHFHKRKWIYPLKIASCESLDLIWNDKKEDEEHGNTQVPLTVSKALSEYLNIKNWSWRHEGAFFVTWLKNKLQFDRQVPKRWRHTK